MKRIIALIALIVLSMSFAASAEKTPYWEDFMETPQMDFSAGHGEMGIRIQPFEYNKGYMLNNGIEGIFFFDYGLGPDTEGHLYFADDKEYYPLNTVKHQMLNASIKHKLVDQNGFSFSLLGKLGYDHYSNDQAIWTPEVSFLFSNIVNKGLKFNHNASFSFYDTGNVGITVENGLAYVINPQNIIKARLETYFWTLESLDHHLKIAYRTHITNQWNYTLLFSKYLEASNTALENIFEFQPTSDLRLTGNYVFNTHKAHRIRIEADKALTQNVTLVAEYDKQLRVNSYSSLVTGLNFKF